MNDQPEPFTYDGGQVEPGETQQLRYAVSETYLGDPVRIPVTIIDGPVGPTAFLSAAIHGDELNGIEIVREVAQEWDHPDVCGTIICLPVPNVRQKRSGTSSDAPESSERSPYQTDPRGVETSVTDTRRPA